MKKSPLTKNKSTSKSPSLTKPMNRKDKDRVRQQYRMQLEKARIEQQKNQAKQQLRKLHDFGIVEAYESFLRNICKNGLPQPSNVYELAAQHVLKFGKKQQEKRIKKQQILEFNSEALRGRHQ